jgi:hypothetical protein
VEAWLHTFLNLAIRRVEILASCPDRYTSRKEPPVPIDLDAVQKRSIPYTCGNINPDASVVKPVASTD